MSYERKYAEALSRVIGDELTLDQIEALIEKPKHEAHGDLAFPCFQLAKAYRKAPVMIATDIAGKLTDELFTKVEATGP